MLAVGSFFFGILVYQMTPRQGEESSITRMMNKYLSRSEDWEEINATHVKAARQAGFDRALFENEVPKERWVDVSYPEYVDDRCFGSNDETNAAPGPFNLTLKGTTALDT